MSGQLICLGNDLVAVPLNAADEPGAPRGAVRAFDTESGDVINRNGDEQDQGIDGYERHVEDAAGDQQQRRSVPPWEAKVQTYNQWKEDRELEGLKQHNAVLGKNEPVRRVNPGSSTARPLQPFRHQDHEQAD
jgi:hypothetical protein